MLHPTMRTPDRILRADVEDLERNPPPLTQREQLQYDRILTLAEGIMARRGSHTLTAAGLAQALCISSGTLRRHFPDLDALLATLLSRHLRKIAHALGEVPHDAPDRPQQLRAAYLAYTRSILGGFTAAHLLLVRDRALLPEDLLTNIERTRTGLGDTLAYGHAEEALGLLDMRSLDAPRIEAALAAIIATAAQQPSHAPPPAPKPAATAIAAARRDRAISANPPWAPRDDLALLQGGPHTSPPKALPDFTRTAGRPPDIHSSA
jgi:AcrR family transcriptional regulator